ncbi:hypothetical protein D9M68_297960 [compost metagenome]
MAQGSLLPLAKQLIPTNSWAPGVGYKFYTYAPGTLTPKATYQDSALSAANTNPVIADARGEVVMYGSGVYRIIAKDASDVTVWDRDNVDTGGYNGTDTGTIFSTQVNRVVDSISALRLLDKTKYTRAFVTGYYAPGDGGGGAYWCDSSDTTSTDNGGTVVLASDGGRWKLQYNGTVSIRQFGAKGDGTTDDYFPIQAAINSGVRRIYFPSSAYVINSALNLTNLPAGKPLHLYGDGAHYDHAGGTRIICRTNGGWMADFTGSQFVTMEDMCFYTDATTPAAKGFLHARSTLNSYAMYNVLKRVIIRLPSNPGSSIVGTIGLLNNCAEHFECEDCWFEADTPYVTTLANEIGVTSAYTTIANTIFSNTAQSFRLCTFTPLSVFPAMILYGLGSANFETCVWIPSNPGSPPANGITFRSSASGYKDCSNVRITGQIESFTSPFRFDGPTHNVDIAVTTSNVTGAHLSMAAEAGGHENLSYKPAPLNNASVAIASVTGPTVTLSGGQLTLAGAMTLNDTNIKLSGTTVVAAGIDMASPSNFNVAAGSSYRAQWAYDFQHFSAIINPGGIPATSSYGTTFAAAGVVLGDKVTVAPPYDTQGVIAFANISSVGNIRLSIANLTGATVTLGSGTWKFAVERPTF